MLGLSWGRSLAPTSPLQMRSAAARDPVSSRPRRVCGLLVQPVFDLECGEIAGSQITRAEWHEWLGERSEYLLLVLKALQTAKPRPGPNRKRLPRHSRLRIALRTGSTSPTVPTESGASRIPARKTGVAHSSFGPRVEFWDGLLPRPRICCDPVTTSPSHGLAAVTRLVSSANRLWAVRSDGQKILRFRYGVGHPEETRNVPRLPSHMTRVIATNGSTVAVAGFDKEPDRSTPSRVTIFKRDRVLNSFLAQALVVGQAKFSPDGRQIAYRQSFSAARATARLPFRRHR